MKKKIIFLFTLFFINIFMVQAEEYTCNYIAMENDSIRNDFHYKINTENNRISESELIDFKSTIVLDLYSRSIGGGTYNTDRDEKKEAEIIEQLSGKCQKYITVCLGSIPTGGAQYILVFNDSILPGTDIFEYNINGTYWVTNSNSCNSFEYKDGNEKGSINIAFSCDKYSNKEQDGLLDLIKNRYEAYTKCYDAGKKKCDFKNEYDVSITKSINSIAREYNEYVTQLKSFCKGVISNQNYNSTCVSKCLSLESDLEPYLLNKSIGKDKCSLTLSIITFISNILKWAKYIAPILVIILSILDFIKAIAAQNDDDMKKAQGKFVKRLIVAALLFLLPLIINFMLKTFGLYNSACDISNLFS